MFRALMYVQWKYSRWVVLVAALAAFATPLLVLAPFGSRLLGAVPAGSLLQSASVGAIALRALAFFAGMFLAAAAWTADQQLDFTHALTRPVPRWYFVGMRFAAGVLLIAAIAAALALSIVVVAIFWELPATLHVYPVGMALRLGLAALVVYVAFFGVVTVPTQISAIWALGILAFLIVADILVLNGRLTQLASDLLGGAWSPLSVFGGRWFFIDV